MFIEDSRIFALIVIGLFVFLSLLGIIYFIVKRIGKFNDKKHILNIKGKYLPMWGEFYLYKDDSTGIVKADCIGGKCAFFDSEDEAERIINSYLNTNKQFA